MTFTVNTARGPVTWTGEDFDADPVTLREISNAWLNHRRTGFDFQLRRFLLPRLDDPIYSYLLLMSLYPDAVVVDGEAPYDLEVPLGAVDGGNAPNEFTKHYGPGPHPGTGTPQSIHGQGRSTGTTFSYDPNLLPDRRSKIEQLFGDDLRRAIAKFNEVFPGALGKHIEVHGAEAIALIWDRDGFAYVNRLHQDRIYINEDYPRYAYFTAAIEQRDYLAAFKQVGGKLESGEMSSDDLEERMLFHELAHSAALKAGDAEGGEGWPYYGPPWYSDTVSPDSPSLPSRYATRSRAEFIAEALTDYAYSEHPVPISLTVARKLKEAVK